MVPLKGYLYKKKQGLFEPFVDSIYSKRQQAKQEGKAGLSFVLKIIMNSLYGRFGINPKSKITDICTYEQFMKIDPKLIVSYHAVTRTGIICSYWDQPDELSGDWFPKLAAVQIAAAIAASARIYMSPFASRMDCYYTDTDSVVLKNPLPCVTTR